jgi:hypothetical protein
MTTKREDIINFIEAISKVLENREDTLMTIAGNLLEDNSISPSEYDDLVQEIHSRATTTKAIATDKGVNKIKMESNNYELSDEDKKI